MTKETRLKILWDDFKWECQYYAGNIRGHYRHFLNCTIRKWCMGFNPEDVYNLDLSIAKYILPRLKYLKIVSNGHPLSLSDKQWHRELNKMIRAFELIADNENDSFYALRNSKKKYRIMNEGLQSFAKYYHSLWW